MPRPDLTLARSDAERLAAVLREVGGAGAPLSTGWMAWDVPGSWARYAAGLGGGRPVERAEIEQLVDAYRRRGVEPAVEVHTGAHRSLRARLKHRGFRVVDGDRVLDSGPRRGAADPRLRRLDPDDPRDLEAFAVAQGEGFFEGGPLPEGMRAITARVARSPRCAFWLATVDGRIAGSAGLERWADLGVCIAGAVAPWARRMGLQTALLKARLDHAARTGLRRVTVGSIPGGPTERNARHLGFRPAFRTERWVLPPERAAANRRGYGARSRVWSFDGPAA